MPDYGYKFSMGMTRHDTISVGFVFGLGITFRQLYNEICNHFKIYIEYMADKYFYVKRKCHAKFVTILKHISCSIYMTINMSMVSALI